MKKLVGTGSYDKWEVQELRKDREFAIAYLQVAMESLEKPEERGGGFVRRFARSPKRTVAWAPWQHKRGSAGNRSIEHSLPRAIRR